MSALSAIVEGSDSMNYGPNKNEKFPNKNLPNVCFIKNVITKPNIQVGDYTYYDDVDGADKFEEFCQSASGIKIIMNGANHRMNSITTYPFNLMGNGWEKATPALEDLPFKGDTVISLLHCGRKPL